MHLKDEDFLKIIYNEVDEEEKRVFNQHLKKCEDCSLKLLELSKIDFYLKYIYIKRIKTIYFPSIKEKIKPLFLFFKQQPDYELSLVPVKGNIPSIESHVVKTKLGNIFVKIVKNVNNNDCIITFIGMDKTRIFILDKEENIILKLSIDKGQKIEKRLILDDFIISTLEDKLRVFF